MRTLRSLLLLAAVAVLPVAIIACSEAGDPLVPAAPSLDLVVPKDTTTAPTYTTQDGGPGEGQQDTTGRNGGSVGSGT